MIRSRLIVETVGLCCALGAVVAEAGTPREPVKARRVLFNCDGNGARSYNNPGYDVNRWIANLFTGLDARHVDALLWCDGAGGNTALYDSQVLERNGARIGKPDPMVTKWIREGHDPPEVVVREARKRGIDVFYSFRINDIHDAFLPEERPTFKIEHPEWQIGEGQPYGYATALNFAVPAVRELKLRTIEEIFSKYDFDGIEIDFMRGPPFFLPGTEPENAHLLTDLLRAARRRLDARAKQRGRRIEVAARVDETVEACHLDGFEVEKWVHEGLIDILIMGSGTIEVDVPAFKRIVAGTPVRIYPCIYGWPSKYMPIPAELARGIATTFWRDAPDGVYLFNWFPHEEKKHYQIELIKQIGDPTALAREDLMYAAERGTPQKEYPHNWMRAKLPTKLKPGTFTEIPIEIGRQVPTGAVIELRVATPSGTPLTIRFDGEEVGKRQAAVHGEVTVHLASQLASAGRHHVGLRVAGGEAEVTAVEIHVRTGSSADRSQCAKGAPSIVLNASAPALERYAAEELKRYLKKLYNLDVPIGLKPAGNGPAFRVGTIGKGLSDQGILLRPDGNGLIVGGGSPRATLWAVYELVERWGVRYLLHGDVLPAEPGELRLPGVEVKREPTLRIRQWRVVNDFAMGPESWGMADYRPVLDQLAKLRFNRILVSIWVWQPFLHLEAKGIARKSAALWFDYRYPITDDMPGRALFGNAKEFWNPDLPPRGARYHDFVAAGEKLVHALMRYARSRGMDSALTAHLTEFPPEFAPLLPGSQKVHQLGARTIVPGSDTPPDDPALTQLSTTVLRTTIDTYPEADYIVLGMPEFRQWTDRYADAWAALDAKYGLSGTVKLEKAIAAAEARTSYPGGAERAVREVKGDINALYFYDRLLGDPATLKGTRKPGVRFIFNSVSEELYPVLGKLFPAGSETLNFVDYTASRIVRRREVLRQIPARSIPAVLIYTLHDDNVGVLPQLVTGSLHELTQDLRHYGWAGFSTRYWLTGDHDPCVTYLARAAWDAGVTPEAVYRDQVRAACGEACVPDMLTVFGEVERVTIALEDHALGLAFPIPGMMTKHLQPGPLPEPLANDREGYRRALAAARRALAKSSAAGREYIAYWIGRLEFGIGYIDCVEATRRIATAEAAGKKAEAAKHAKTAVRIARDMLEAYARVARDQSDRGAIATMVEYVYRALNRKAQALHADE